MNWDDVYPSAEHPHPIHPPPHGTSLARASVPRTSSAVATEPHVGPAATTQVQSASSFYRNLCGLPSDSVGAGSGRSAHRPPLPTGSEGLLPPYASTVASNAHGSPALSPILNTTSNARHVEELLQRYTASRASANASAHPHSGKVLSTPQTAGGMEQTMHMTSRAYAVQPLPLDLTTSSIAGNATRAPLEKQQQEQQNSITPAEFASLSMVEFSCFDSTLQGKVYTSTRPDPATLVDDSAAARALPLLARDVRLCVRATHMELSWDRLDGGGMHEMLVVPLRELLQLLEDGTSVLLETRGMGGFALLRLTVPDAVQRSAVYKALYCAKNTFEQNGPNRSSPSRGRYQRSTSPAQSMKRTELSTLLDVQQRASGDHGREGGSGPTRGCVLPATEWAPPITVRGRMY